ncbi:MAG: amidohydrolase [Flavobacteriaceae bacterium]|nr:amidohydrolase [Flavobacteriaceae bacterium]MDZ4149154.1 amidohydrolase [Flavobacteriaceae bacterium]
MPPDLLHLALLQTSLYWENPNENLISLSQKIDALPEQVQLVVLPEMFTSGFTMNPAAVAENMHGKSIEWMRKTAMKKQLALVGSLVIAENNQYFNRLVFVHPSGKMEQYDKRHLFTLAGENKVYTSGKERLIVNYNGWRICPLVCYDLRFPVWSRNTEAYDLLIYVANWPKPRMDAWDALLKARAIENMSYVAGVNRVGIDGNKHEYSGHSAVYDALGRIVVAPQIDEEKIVSAVLDKKSLQTNREKLKFLEDQDAFSLK